MILALLACSEFALQPPDPTPPADPPAVDPDADFGQPPDWSTCSPGWFGQYFNPIEDLPTEPPSSPEELDAWSDLSFRRFDTSLELGGSWWPVDDGYAGDPATFGVRWTGWMRASRAGPASFVLGAADVVWLAVDGEWMARSDASEPEVHAIEVETGQFRVELRFAQLGGDTSSLRFRAVSPDVELCPPRFD